MYYSVIYLLGNSSAQKALAATMAGSRGLIRNGGDVKGADTGKQRKTPTAGVAQKAAGVSTKKDA